MSQETDNRRDRIASTVIAAGYPRAFVTFNATRVRCRVEEEVVEVARGEGQGWPERAGAEIVDVLRARAREPVTKRSTRSQLHAARGVPCYGPKR